METATQQVTLKVPDISCGHCEATVKEAVGGLDGVERVEASAETKQVVVAFDASKVDLPRISSALDEAGYPVQA